MPTKRCPECGGWFDAEVFFRRNHATYASIASGRQSVCFGCEQTRRDATKRKADGRWAVKIRDMIRRHAVRLKLTVAALEQQFGWHFDRMMHEAQHAYANGCAYCGVPFRTMGHGLSDLTLDILNPREPPYYHTNVKWACATCNREKSRTPPALWGAKRAAWETWQRRVKQPVQPKFWDNDEPIR